MPPLLGIGRLDLLETAVGERPALHAPRPVERVDGAEFLLEPRAERRLAVLAEAPLVVGVDLVVDLPADDGGIARKGLCEFGDDDAVLFTHDGRRLAGMAAGGDVGADEFTRDHARFGILHEHPARRGRRGRAEDGRDAVFIQLLHDVFEPREVKFPLLRLHTLPRELADAHGIDPQLLHAGDILFLFRALPKLGVICRT